MYTASRCIICCECLSANQFTVLVRGVVVVMVIVCKLIAMIDVN